MLLERCNLNIFRAKRVSDCYMQEKKTDRLSVCLDVRLILVLVLGRRIVYGQNTVYLCLSKYIVFENTHTHTPAASETISTAASETEGVAAVSCMESHMNRRPLGSIYPNSIHETELHTECRRRRERESLYSPQHDRDRDAARQRAAATRRRETDEARAERLRANRQRKATRRQQETSREVCVCVSVLGCVYTSCARWLLAKNFVCK